MRKRLLLSLLLCLGFQLAFSSVGDTIKVKTFTFDYGVRPTGGNPRIGKFVIPDSLKSKSFSKILMRYTLKCDPSQNPNCGEWDYLTYTILKEKTGQMDSLLYSQPRFKVNYSIKDTLEYINSPSYKYKKGLKKNTSFTSISSRDSVVIGNGNLIKNNLFSSGTNGGRNVFIIKADEISAAGFVGNSISALNFYVQDLASTINVKGLKIEIKNTVDSIIKLSSFSGLTEVFYNDYTLANNLNNVTFNSNFIWDGVSNILISVSYDSKEMGAVPIRNISSYDKISAISINPNTYMGFGSISKIVVDDPVLDSITKQVTVMFWAKGDDYLQPKSGSIFEGVNSKNKRYLNAHLPWGDGTIYWDAGNNNSGYDRISKSASASIYKGSWNHWALTKNSTTGIMNIYLNGSLWHTGSSKTFPMDSLKTLIIGSCSSCGEPGKSYSGAIDNFYVFHKELDVTEVNQYIYQKLDTNYSKYNKLVFAFNFNEGEGNIINNSFDNNFNSTTLDGFLGWSEYQEPRINDFVNTNYRPNINFVTINGTKITDSIEIFKPQVQIPISIVRYDNIINPSVPSDTVYKWGPYYKYNLTSAGVFIDSVFINKDTTLYLSYYNYYGTPFEKINKWELGRFITPYGNGLDLGQDGWTWTYDVSDFVQKLKDTIDLEAGNFQELLDLQFWFIEGTPSRDVIRIENLWQGNINLVQFEDKVKQKNIVRRQGENMFKLRTCLTGHGMTATNNAWAEFSENMHSVHVNGQKRWEWEIIQECADNPLYPQGGTWIFDRAGWCPGMPGKINEFELTPFFVGDSIAIQYKIAGKEGGNYVTESHLVTYGNPNFAIDASVETIIVPSDDKQYLRENPSVGKPKIIIKNNGSSTLTSAKITYKINGGTQYIYNWSGSLEFLESEIVYLPIPDWSELIGDNGYFNVIISEPNSLVDENPYNNENTSHFKLPSLQATNKIRLSYRTNHAPTETKWKLSKANGDIIFQSPTSLNANTAYSEVIPLSNGGYKLFISDANDDGLEFWYNINNGGTAGSTRISFYDTINSYWGGDIILESDFGKSIEYNFVVNGFVGLNEANAGFRGVLLYPNPTSNKATLILDGVDGRTDILIRDYLGRIIDTYNENASNNRIQTQIDISSYPKGIYIIQIKNDDKVSIQKLIKK
ncbi:MAG: hypothetical protein H6Q15_1389 [Bacteroidetes bacterium]|nr:hypothetical protein [Bacteroidota bacterium]